MQPEQHNRDEAEGHIGSMFFSMPTALFCSSQSEKFCLTVQTCAISPAEWQLGNNLQIGTPKRYWWLMLPLNGLHLRNYLDLNFETFKVRCLIGRHCHWPPVWPMVITVQVFQTAIVHVYKETLPLFYTMHLYSSMLLFQRGQTKTPVQSL